MNNLAVWLMSMVTPVIKRVLIVLGIGTVSYAAITPLINSVISNVQSNYGAIPSSIAQFLNLVGAGEAFTVTATPERLTPKPLVLTVIALLFKVFPVELLLA